MEKEVGATVSTIETLLTNKLHNVTISVLLNGGKSDLLKSLCNQYDFINYYESDKNLGVAGGRNFLFSTEECQASDIVMLMDNDVKKALEKKQVN